MEVIEEPKGYADTKIAVGMREQGDSDLRDLISGIGEESYEIRISRRMPRTWIVNGQQMSIEGHLGTFTELPTEDDLQQMYGGGTYCLKLLRPNKKGSMVYFKSSTVKLPGQPKGAGITEPAGAKPEAEDAGVVVQAMTTMKELINEQKNSQGMDYGLLETVMAPLRLQLQQSQEAMARMQETVAAKDSRILELITQKPDTSEKDNLLNKMFDTEASRTNNLRAVHESEIRMMRENARDDMKRVEDRHAQELRSREESHRREIDNLQRSVDAQTNAINIGFNARIEAHKMEISRLQAELSECRVELTALRAKKEKTLIEQASELHSIGEKLSVLGIGPAKEEPSHWTERIANAILENPGVIASAAQAMGSSGASSPAQPHSAPQQLNPPPGPQATNIDHIPIGQPFRMDDGQVYIKIPPDGSVVTYEQAQKIAESEIAARQEAEKEQEDPQLKQIKTAISFAESAFSAETPAQEFAKRAKPHVPEAFLDLLKEEGIDNLLSDPVLVPESSPLKTQAGKAYMREVAQFLIGE